MFIRKFLVLLVSFTAVTVWGQESDPIQTDRPGFINSSTVLERGIFQFESGASHTQSDEVDLTKLGELLLRYGISKNLEIRFGLNSLVVQRGLVRDTGFESSDISVKYNLLDGGGKIGNPSLSVLAGSSLPTGIDFGDDEAEQFAGIAVDGAVSKNHGLAGYVEYNEGSDEFTAGVYLSGALPSKPKYSYALGYAGFFVDETPGVVGATDNSAIPVDDQHLVDGNLMLALNPKSQIDFSLSLGVSDESPDFIVGFGYSRRF